MQYEAGGYPQPPTGFTRDTWRLLVVAGRIWEQKDAAGQIQQYGYAEPISQFENTIEITPNLIQSAKDVDISISSANPYQTVQTPFNNSFERMRIENNCTMASRRFANSKRFIYGYVLHKHYELKYSGIADDIFSRIRIRVDNP